ncbi:MAG TPA: hypothetical protein VIW24_32145 [Aldersonia sp.]
MPAHPQVRESSVVAHLLNNTDELHTFSNVDGQHFIAQLEWIGRLPLTRAHQPAPVRCTEVDRDGLHLLLFFPPVGLGIGSSKHRMNRSTSATPTWSENTT